MVQSTSGRKKNFPHFVKIHPVKFSSIIKKITEKIFEENVEQEFLNIYLQGQISAPLQTQTSRRPWFRDQLVPISETNRSLTLEPGGLWLEYQPVLDSDLEDLI